MLQGDILVSEAGSCKNIKKAAARHSGGAYAGPDRFQQNRLQACSCRTKLYHDDADGLPG
jgi:hypothetical protein